MTAPTATSAEPLAQLTEARNLTGGQIEANIESSGRISSVRRSNLQLRPIHNLAASGNGGSGSITENEKQNSDNVFAFRSGVTGFGDGSNGRSVLDAGAASASAGANQPGYSTDNQYASVGNLALAPGIDAGDEEGQPVGNSAKVTLFRIVPTTQGEFDINLWKPSRENPGNVIKRIEGYDITEDKYGISYLYRLPGGGTTTEQGEHSGYLNWQALEVAGRLKKGVTHGKIKRRIKGDGNR